MVNVPFRIALWLITFLACFTSSWAGQFKDSGNNVTFLVLADWGGIPIWPYFSPFEYAVARQMGKVASRHNAKFVLALGDNFYEQGVTSVDDPRFRETYEQVFHMPSLQVPWYVVGGNHDHYGNISAQVAYSKVSSRWKFPDLYHSHVFDIPNTGRKVAVILVDTVILCGLTDDKTTGSNLPGPVSHSAAEEQWEWLEKQLELLSTADYLIVAGHYPVWSIAEHGPTALLVSRLLPLLEKYNVTAYLSGHDHNLQHIKQGNSSVEYFVIGSADVVDPSRKHADSIPPSWLKFMDDNIASLGGFARVTASSESMKLTFITGLMGKEVYSVVMHPRAKHSEL
ncbi:tartrate-resistant acid phosphatase type 5-like [Diadema antillarum]|uniref:tartrate-resistant acid phosphatase type 5-like n=1 Tax=Diadema antillarum TaxID=105358 RepID=UPI003A8354A9